MPRLLAQVLAAAVVLVPLSLLGLPTWVYLVGLGVVIWAVCSVLLPDGPARDRPMRERLPSPRGAVTLVVLWGVTGTFSAVGLLDSWLGFAAWVAVLVAIVVVAWTIERRRRPRTV